MERSERRGRRRSRLRRLARNSWVTALVRMLSMSCCISVPTIAIFWEENGLTKSEAFLLQIWFAFAWAVCEIVTGRFADRFGRVFAMRTSAMCVWFAGLFYLYGDSFSSFALAEFAGALGLALLSGTDEALIFDTFKELRLERRFQSSWGRISSAGFWFMAPAGVIGSVVASYDVRAPFLMVCVLFTVNLALTGLLTEPEVARLPLRESELASVRRAAVLMLGSSERLRLLTLLPTLVLGFAQPALWLYTAYLVEGGVRIEWLGAVFGFFHVVAAVSAMMGGQLRGQTGYLRWLLLPIGAVALTYFGMAWYVGIWGAIVIVPQQWVRSFFRTLYAKEINDCLPSDIRATALSVRNTFYLLWYILAMVPVWLWIDEVGPYSIMQLLAVLMLMSSLLILGLHRAGARVTAEA